jgi:eukaryotic translation initiation factor 2C
MQSLRHFAFPLAMRNDVGSSGRSIQLRTNFFPINTLPNTVIHHYCVSIIPQVPPAKNQKIFRLWEQLASKNEFLDNIKPVYDGRYNMYTPIPILMDSDLSTFHIDYFEEDEFPVWYFYK